MSDSCQLELRPRWSSNKINGQPVFSALPSNNQPGRKTSAADCTSTALIETPPLDSAFPNARSEGDANRSTGIRFRRLALSFNSVLDASCTNCRGVLLCQARTVLPETVTQSLFSAAG